MDDYFNNGNSTDPLLDNPNSNANLSAVGMTETLAINFGVFVIVMMIFESNRFYKQIYLKRLQNRFQALGRVPAYPPEETFGWLKEIRKISEMDLLRMVGLDAYMCLRYIVICFKFACFLSFWGLILLVPTYGTANDNERWDRFAISNVLAAHDKSFRLRLWISALCGYMFAAYFCQLLYAEYNNFSVRRLQYLVQSDGDTGLSDPDTPPQKYYTVMIERIPSHLRSAQELHKFFEKLFPDDVYTVEIALDLSELDSKCKQRKVIRDKLEKAIAHYEAKNERPVVRVYTGNYTRQGATNGGIFDGDSLIVFLSKALAWEQYGYEWLDAIAYYTQELQDLNEQVVKLQKENYERVTKADEKLLAKLKNKHDTRIAHVFENISSTGAKTIQAVTETVVASSSATSEEGGSAKETGGGSGSVSPTAGGGSVFGKLRRMSIDSVIFGGGGTKNKRIEFDKALDQELGRIEKDVDQLSAMKAKKPPVTLGNLEPVKEAEAEEEESEEVYTEQQHQQQQQTEQQQQVPHYEPLSIDVVDERARSGSHSGHELDRLMLAAPRSGRRASLNPMPSIKAESIMNALQEEPLFKEMMENAGVDLEKEEEEARRRRLEYEQDVLSRQQELLRKGTEAELRAYVESAGVSNPNSIVNRNRPLNPFAAATSTKPFAESDAAAAAGMLHRSRSRSRSHSSTSMPDNISISSSDDDFDLENVNKFDENDLKSSMPSTKRPSRTNDFIDMLGDMRKMNSRDNYDEPVAEKPPTRRASIMDTLGDMRKAHSHFQLADELGSSVHGSRRAVALANPRMDEPRPPPSVDSLLVSGGIASLPPIAPVSGGGGSSSSSSSSSAAPSVPKHPVSSISTLFGAVGSSASGAAPTSTSSGGYSSLQDHDVDEDVEKGAVSSRSSTPSLMVGGGGSSGGVTLAETGSRATRPRKESGASILSSNTTNRAGIATLNPLLTGTALLTDEQREKVTEITRVGLQRAKTVSKEGLNQTMVATKGALRGAIEVERTLEMLLMGAYYKYSSTAFVTFKSRVTESIAYQMLLSHDTMEISHAPNPHDIIWDNVAIPKSQITLRHYITNIGVTIGSIFWSSLVNSVNIFASWFPLPASFQQLTSAVVMLVFLLLLPFVFDFVARYYEGMKLESEIQNSIMTRYFYYQLINVYVTVGFSGSNLWLQIINTLQKPQTLVDIIGGRVPSVSIFFTNLIIVKIFTAIPLEMVRPWQLSTILLMGNCMDRRETTRRDLRTGAFYSWPMLYGWIYPQLMMVLMIMCVYSCITPLMMPFCALFFAFAYLMYKYQLLYVYINEYQSGGFMWYAVFNRSLIALFFASVALLGYLSLQLGDDTLMAGPFFFLLPLPFCIAYFGHYCTQKFKKPSMNLSYGFARELDHRNAERRAASKPTPLKTFTKTLYRQPSLTEKEVYPEPYRNDGTYDILRNMDGDSVLMADWKDFRTKRGSLSINVHELTDEGEEDQRVLVEYFREVVLPLSIVPDPNESSTNGGDSHHGSSSHGGGIGVGVGRRHSGSRYDEQDDVEGGAENVRPFGRQRR